MEAPNYSETLAKITSGVHAAVLKSQGFKKSGNVFNRSTPDGLVEVITFQAGQYEHFAKDVPAMNYYPNAYHGYFTVNLGVFVPELADELAGKKRKKFAHEYECPLQLRKRIGFFNEEKDLWFSLADDADETISRVSTLITQHAFPYFESLDSRGKIIAMLEKKVAHGPTSNDRIVLALMLMNESKKSEAESLLRQQYDTTDKEGHKKYILELAGRLGLKVQ